MRKLVLHGMVHWAVSYTNLDEYKRQVYEDANDEQKQALVLGNIGNVYLEYKKYEPAKESFDKTILIAKKNNYTSILANAYSGIMNYYFQQNKLDQALKYGNMSVKYLKELNMQSDIATLYLSLIHI